MVKSMIVSLGYERRSINELMEILAENNVKKLLDIRLLPVSRRKGFSKTKLSEKLKSIGIDYLHLQSAGNPYYKEATNITECLELYTSYLKANPDILDSVAREITKSPIAVLCYERKHEQCHRSILLDLISNNGLNVNVVRIE